MKDRIFSLGVLLELVVLLLLPLLRFQHSDLDNLHSLALLQFHGKIQISKYLSHHPPLVQLSHSKDLQPLLELSHLFHLQHPRQTASLTDLNSRTKH